MATTTKFHAAVEIGAKVKGALAGLGRVRSAFASVGKSAGKAGKSMGKVALAFSAVGVGVAAAGYKIASSTAAANDQLAKASRRVGLTAQTYAELRHAADLAGVSADEFANSMKFLNLNLGKASTKQGELYALLKKVSPALLKQVLAARDNEDAFRLLTGAMAKLSDPSKRAALAVAAFGEVGAKMTTIVEGGADGIEAARKQFRRYYDVVDGKALKASEDFVDAQANLKLALGGVRDTIGNALIPAMTPLLEKFAQFVSDNREMIGGKVRDAFEGLAKAVSNVNMDRLIRGAESLFVNVSKVAEGFANLIGLVDTFNAGQPKNREARVAMGARPEQSAVDLLPDWMLDPWGVLASVPGTGRWSGDKGVVDFAKRHKAGEGRSSWQPAAPVGPMMSELKPTQTVGGTVEIKVTTDPGTTARVERVESESRAVPLKASTGRRSTGTGRP